MQPQQLCACAIEEYHKTLSLMKASLNQKEDTQNFKYAI